MVVYDYDSKAIISKPIKTRQAANIRNDFLRIHRILKSRGRDTNVYIMENECSGDLKEDKEKYTIYFQLAPPHMRRRNAE